MILLVCFGDLKQTRGRAQNCDISIGPDPRLPRGIVNASATVRAVLLRGASMGNARKAGLI